MTAKGGCSTVFRGPGRLSLPASLLVCALLGGCAGLGQPPWAVPGPLQYNERLASLAPAELAAEQQRLEAALHGGNQQPAHPGVARVQLALLLLHSKESGTEAATRAAGLLQQALQAGPGDNPWQAYRSLAGIELERLQLRETLAACRESGKAGQQRIAEMEQRISHLTAQIEQVKDIEQRLIEREQAQESQ